MKRTLMPLFDALLYSNVYVSFIVALLALSAIDPNAWCNRLEIISLAFFSTLSMYSLERLFEKGDKSALTSKRWVWLFSHRHYLWIQTTIGVAIAGALFLRLPRDAQILMLLTSFVCGLYLIPFVRSLPLAKTIMVVFSWFSLTHLLPFLVCNLYIENTLSSHHFLFDGLHKLTFVAVTAIGFDLRDLQRDKSTRTKSIPVLIGYSTTIRLCLCISTLSLVGTMLLSGGWKEGIVTIFIHAILLAWLLGLKSVPRSDYYFDFLGDGVLLALGIALLMNRF